MANVPNFWAIYDKQGAIVAAPNGHCLIFDSRETARKTMSEIKKYDRVFHHVDRVYLESKVNA